ncbi:Dyp-type peroxidase [Simiduia agarivorans]|uniref:Dyp-type peroxidase family protein n=1 Tax=Simiduia agarivorans (strain DSM 21679 / JCM 13881 / BCRC 17597 / SA1) TaxID=1117647 RepID=K4KFR5_SIMAS|nr:Dyp-type peroxidase [Simiduia agarivorans]AFU97919.1 Dyp-type peroxidase family protein [Simiduia agarivorans SA1 = DSM 21679]
MQKTQAQTAILAPLPQAASYVFFKGQSTKAQLFECLMRLSPGDDLVGIGQPLAMTLGLTVADALDYPSFANSQRCLPQTPFDLLVWVRGADAGEVALKIRQWQQRLVPHFSLVSSVDAFLHRDGRDLTGYEDGTENPDGAAAAEAALDGSGASYLALQQWRHRMDEVEHCSREQMNHIIGRDQASNRELTDAPASAHVKRTEQEAFEPHRFVLRRSMPWVQSGNMGLMFAAFGCDTQAFEAQMWRMLGRDDGIEDALFAISEPMTGVYFYCPPCVGGRLNLE